MGPVWYLEGRGGGNFFQESHCCNTRCSIGHQWLLASPMQFNLFNIDPKSSIYFVAQRQLELFADLFYSSWAVPTILLFNVFCKMFFFIYKWLAFQPVGLHQNILALLMKAYGPKCNLCLGEKLVAFQAFWGENSNLQFLVFVQWLDLCCEMAPTMNGFMHTNNLKEDVGPVEWEACLVECSHQSSHWNWNKLSAWNKFF